MQYGQIVFLLFIVLLSYYAALIVLDILKAKAVQAVELESQSEEDIDISDEAKTFKPFRISRDEPKQNEDEPEEQSNETENKKDNVQTNQEEQPESNSEKPFKRPGHRNPIMTDGILVEDLINEINKLTETAACDLGLVIIDCENAR